MGIFRLIKKGYEHTRKSKFISEFQFFDRSSGIDKNCLFVGKKHIIVGSNTHFGHDCEIIAYDTHFDQPLNSRIVIGDNVRMTRGCRVTCAGNITINNDVLIAPDVMITDHNHGMNPIYPGGYSPQPLIVKDVVIDEGVWIGHGVSILPGVTIGKHSIIGANSVVTKDISEYSIAVGAPAKVIKKWNFEQKIWVKVDI